MQTQKNCFIVTSNRTLRCGMNPAAVMIKANLCNTLFWVNCKYSNTLRNKYDEKGPNLPTFINAKYRQVSLMDMITVYGGQADIWTHTNCYIYMGMGKGNSAHKNWERWGFACFVLFLPKKEKKKGSKLRNMPMQRLGNIYLSGIHPVFGSVKGIILLL